MFTVVLAAMLVLSGAAFAPAASPVGTADAVSCSGNDISISIEVGVFSDDDSLTGEYELFVGQGSLSQSEILDVQYQRRHGDITDGSESGRQTTDICLGPGNTYTVYVEGDSDTDWDQDFDQTNDPTPVTGDGTDDTDMADPYVYDTYKTNDPSSNLGSDDDGGEGYDTSYTFTLSSPPTADASNGFSGTTSIVEGGTSISFDGSASSDPDGDSLSYSWTFDDGSTASGVTTAHDYSDGVTTNGGSVTYTPSLTVTDDSSFTLSDTESDFASITVYNDFDGDGLADDDSATGVSTDNDDDDDGISDSNDPAPYNVYPSASDSSSESTDEDSTLTVGNGDSADLTELATDGYESYDPNTDPISIEQIDGGSFSAGSTVTLDSGATVTVESDGSWTYDPNGAYENLASGDTATDEFTYTVSDDPHSGTAAATEQGTVSITINGANDAPTAPTDDDGATDEVSEDDTAGTAVGITASSTDPDDGETPSYSLTDDANGRFNIDSSTGEVTVDDPSKIDHEIANSHTITVEASDGTDAITSDFTITVTDADETPSFDSVGTQTVSESSSDGTEIVDIAADVIQNGDTPDDKGVSYQFTSGNSDGAYAIDSSTGKITVTDASKIDYEASTSRTVTVEASEGNQANTQDVTIDVTDSDETPSFTSATSTAVSEDASAGTNVQDVQADVGGNDDEGVSYQFTSGNGDGAYAIDSSTGQITVADPSKIDHEASASRTVTVEASEGSQANTQTLTIDVTDVDERPSFASGASATVSESNSGGTNVLDLNATVGGSDDEGVSYAITDGNDDVAGNGGGAFAIDSSTGQITINDTADIDESEQSSFTLTVAAIEGSNRTLQPRTIDVTDDVAPSFLPESSTPADDTTGHLPSDDIILEFAENVTLGSGSIEIVDDTDSSSTRSLFVTTEFVTASDNTVTLSPAGNLESDTDYHLEIADTAIDDYYGNSYGGLVDSTTHNFTTADVSPAFTAGESINLSLREDGSLNLTGALEARDNSSSDTLNWSVDSTPSNGSLSGIDGESIAVSGSNSPYTLSTSPTYTPDADFAGSDSFEVNVSDSNPGAFAIITVSVTVDPVNDAPSTALGSNQSVGNATSQQTVSNFATGFDPGGGSDEDSQSIGDFVVSSGNNALFDTEPDIDNTGDLTYTPADDVVGTTTVDVQVVDDGGTSNGGNDTSSSKSFTITVDNQDPTFADGPATTAPVDEGTTGQILDVEADDDTGTNSDTDVTYSLGSAVGDDTDFSIDSATGDLDLDSPRDFEDPSDSDGSGDYELTVTATDSDGNTAEQSVTVTLDDVDESPSFTSATSPTVLESDSGGTTVLDVNATIGGSDDEGVSYTITAGNDDVAGNGGGAFAIDSSSGQLTIADTADIDESEQPSFSLTVEAGEGSATTTQTLSVTVTDDVAPTFEPAASTPPAGTTDHAPIDDIALEFDEGVTLDTGDISVVDDGDGSSTTTLEVTTNSVTASGSTVTLDPPSNLEADTDYHLEIDTGAIADNYANSYGGFSDTTTYNFTTADTDPSFTSSGPVSVSIDEDGSLNLTSVLEVRDNSSSDTLNWSVASTPSNGTLSGIDGESLGVSGSDSPHTLDSSPTYTPDTDFAGSDSVEVTVTDTNPGVSTTLTVTVTVDAVNDRPSISLGPDQTVEGTTSQQTVQNFATSFDPGGGSDESSQSIDDFLLSNSDTSLFATQPDIDTSGTLSFTPAQGVQGTATIDVQVVDDGGTSNGGNDTSAVRSLNITVDTGVNFTLSESDVTAGPITSTNEADYSVDLALPGGNEQGSLNVTLVGPSGTTLSNDSVGVPRDAGTLTVSNFDGSLLDDGDVTVVGTFSDQSTNTEQTSTTVTKDTRVNFSLGSGSLVAGPVQATNQSSYGAALALPADNEPGSVTLTLAGPDGATASNASVSVPQDAGTIAVENVDASGLSDGQVTVTATFEDNFGQTEEVSTTVTKDTRPEFAVSIDNTSAPINEGETLSVNVTVENVGGAAGTQDLILSKFDGSQVDSRSVTVPAKSGRTLSLAWAAKEGTAGTGDVTVSSENSSAAETVTVEQAAYVPGSLTATLADNQIPEGTATDLIVEVTFTNGTTAQISDSARLRSNDTAVAIVDVDGRVSAEGKGVASLTAFYQGDSASATLGVTSGDYIEDSVSARLGESQIANGTTTGLVVEADFTNSSTRTVTGAASLTSSDPSVATIGDDGTVTAQSQGTATLTATYRGDTATETLTVTAGAYVEESLNATLVERSVADGTATDLIVEAEFTDGTTQPVTSAASLRSNDTGVATVGSDGTVTATGEGAAEVTATYQGDTETETLTVTAGEYVAGSLNVTLAAESIPNGTTTELFAEAEFTNGTTRTVTGEAALTASNTTGGATTTAGSAGVATIADDGTVTAVGQGTAQLTATYRGDTESETLTVTAGEYIQGSLNATLAEDSVANGTTTALVVEAAFTDGSTRTVTSAASLTSTDTTVATVGTGGTVTAVGQGTAQFTAGYGGDTETETLTVTAGEYVEGSLNATLVERSVPNGTATDLIVEAEFTDGTTQTVTSAASLRSNDTGVATVGSDGTITATGEGVAAVTATYQGDTETETLTVTAGEYVAGSLNATLVEEAISTGETTEVLVTAAFTDGSTRTVTSAASLASNDTGVATVATSGTVTAQGQGVAEVTATYRGESESETLTVERPAESALSGLDVAGQGTDATITDGANKSVAVSVTNAGDRAGSFDVSLDVGSGTITETQSTSTLGAGGSETVVFENVTGTLGPGEYEVGTSTGDDTANGNLTVQAPGEANLSALDVALQGANATIVAGETANVSVSVENTGDQAESFAISLSMGNDAVEETQSTGELAGGETETLSFEGVTGALGPGSHPVTVTAGGDVLVGTLTVEQQATAALSGLDVAGQGPDATIGDGEDRTVVVNVTNVGDQAGSFDVSLDIGSGTITETQSTSDLGAGGSETVVFENVTGTLGPGEYGVETSSDDDTASGNLTVQAPGEATLSGLDIASQNATATIAAGEAATVSVSVENTGDQAESFSLSLSIGTDAVDDVQSTGAVASGESETVAFENVTGTLGPGTYQVTVSADGDTIGGTLTVEQQATAALSALDVAGQGANATIGSGASESVAVVVENVGDLAGSFDVSLDIGTGAVTETQSTAELAGGGTETLTFASVTDGLAPGNYAVTVSGDGDSVAGSLDVTGSPEGGLSSLDIAGDGANATVPNGSNADIAVDVTNGGDQADSFDVSLDVGGGAVTETQSTAELAGGESETVTFETVTGGLAPGNYTVTVSTANDSLAGTLHVATAAVFELTNVTTESAAPGQEAAVTATVENVGGATATNDLELRGGTPLMPYAGSDGVIGTPGLLDAIPDWRAGEISTMTLLNVISAWQSGEVVDEPVVETTAITLDGGETTTVTLTDTVESGDGPEKTYRVRTGDDEVLVTVEIQ